MEGQTQFEKYCNHVYLYEKEKTLTTAQLCPTFGESYCTQPDDFINFYQIFFCLLQANKALLIIFAVICTFFIFRYVALVVDEYCAEGITKISNWLNFSQSLAGVTLLAFANGAGDVLTAIVASGAEGGVFYNIGSIYGAGLFVCCIVMAAAIFGTGDIHYDRHIVYRDLSFYILATLMTFVFGIIGKITWVSSLCLLLIYVLQVSVVIWQDRKKGQQEVEHDPQTMIDNRYTNLENGEVGEEPSYGRNETKGAQLWRGLKKTYTKNSHFDFSASGGQIFSLIGTKNIIKQYKRSRLEEGEESEEEEEESLFWHIVDFPFLIAAYLTLLPIDIKDYKSRTRCFIWAFTGTFFEFFVIFKFDLFSEYSKLFIWFGCAMFFFSLFLIILPRSPSLPSSAAFKFIVINSVIVTIFWMYFLIELLMDLLSVIGMVFDIEPSYLGFTVLAIGNALPDALSTIALFKMEGQSLMALSGAYNGQLFGLLVGFGLGNLKMTLTMGPQEFKLFEKSKIRENLIGIVTVLTAFIVLIVTWISAVMSGFKLGKKFATFLISAYLLFILGASVYTFMGLSKVN